MTMTTVDSAGIFHRSRYCIRCIIAIECKKRHSKDGSIAIQKGDLKFDRLSNKFQKAWNAFVPPFCKTKNQDERRELMFRLYKEIGIEPTANIEGWTRKPRKTAKEKEQEMSRISELEKSIRREKRRAKQIAEEISKQNQRVATCQLSLKLAMERGDHNELNARCGELVALKRTIDELCEKLKGQQESEEI